MTKSSLPPEDLATEIIQSHDDISPLFSDVVENIKKLRVCGLDDAKIREVVPGMYRVKETAAEEGGLKPPAPKEIRVISLPDRFQRQDWT